MFLVVSNWEALPGRDEDFDRVGPVLAKILRRQPGVEIVEVIKNGSQHVAIHGYRDEAAYHTVVDDPQGEFSRALTEYRVDDVARWISSVRGESMPH